MSWNTVLWIAVIVLVMGFYAEVHAVTDFRIAGFSGRIAFVQVETPIGNTFLYGGSVNLGNINTNAYLRVDVLYWKSAKALDAYYWRVKNLSDLATKINIKYEIPCDNVIPYVGVGLSIHKYIWHYDWYGSSWDYDEAKLGFQIFTGAEFPMRDKVYWFWEGSFDRSNRDQYIIAGGVGYRIK